MADRKTGRPRPEYSKTRSFTTGIPYLANCGQGLIQKLATTPSATRETPEDAALEPSLHQLLASNNEIKR